MQVGILTLLFNKSESYPLLLGLFLNEDVYGDFGLAGYSILVPMDRTLESK